MHTFSDIHTIIQNNYKSLIGQSRKLQVNNTIFNSMRISRLYSLHLLTIVLIDENKHKSNNVIGTKMKHQIL